uniref:Uncharacterized protein n=1 Tax=Aquila chrysaetos chrysaetos TaxID=223781 RepID=A0A663EIH9_AQUCH
MDRGREPGRAGGSPCHGPCLPRASDGPGWWICRQRAFAEGRQAGMLRGWGLPCSSEAVGAAAGVSWGCHRCQLGLLSPTTCFPPTLRGKGVYFVKKKRENITLENSRLHAALCKGRARPSAQLSPLLQVMSPLLLSKENMAGWPGVVVEDIMRQVHRLKNEMFVMGGKIQGKPLLPLPEHLDGQDGSSTVLEWWVLPVLLGASEAWQGPRAA